VIGGRAIVYTLKRSRRRRAISLIIDDAGLRVGAPWTAAQGEIDGMLQRHADWIVRKLDDWNSRRQAPRRWSDGETLMLLGSPITLALADHPCNPQLEDSALRIGGETDPSRIEGVVVAWLRQRALACFVDRAAYFSELLAVRPSEIRLSAARSRWGSCHPGGRVLLNWRLVQCPLRLVDYVVAHELAHLLHMNHSERFWRTVGVAVPDYAERRRELRTEGARYLHV
jgi:predicted metal-dependent hydrolase